MAIEETLASIDASLKSLLVIAQTGAAAPAALGAPEAKPAAAAGKSKAAATAGKAAGSAPTATAGAAAAGTTSFQSIVDVLTEVSKSAKEGHGRPAVMAFLNTHLAHLPEAERKVPKLQALENHDELLAAAKAVLAGEAVAEVEADPFA